MRGSSPKTTALALCVFISLLLVIYNSQMKYELKIKDLLISTQQHEKSILSWSMGKKNKIHEKFQNIIDTWCNSQNISLNYECLDHMHEFQQTHSMTNLQECLYDRHEYRIHTFWQIRPNDSSGVFYIRVLRLNIMSFLSTQNLKCVKMTLWTLSPASTVIDQIRREFAYYIDCQVLEIKQFDLESLCMIALEKRTHFAQSSICAITSDDSGGFKSKNLNLVGFSDFVRFFILDIYGGIYLDGDVMLLQDMSILFAFNFAYRWSFTKNLNTAVLGLNQILETQNNDLYSLFVSSNKNTIPQLIQNLHPNKLSDLIRRHTRSAIFAYESLAVFHSALFDPAWLCLDSMISNPNAKFVCSPVDFTNRKLIEPDEFAPERFFPGAFTYHLHLSRNDFFISNQSYFFYFEQFFKKKLKLNSV